MARIHPTALVDPKAELDDDVEVGPSVVRPSSTQWAPMRVPAPTRTCGPMRV